jgi:N utilization substance protein B
LDAATVEKEPIIQLIMGELKITKNAALEAYEEAFDIFRKRDELDTIIGKFAKAYTIDRIHRVERNILRIGVYELLYRKDVPPLVVIAEGIRLGNKFSTDDACKFVNAVLDTVMKESASGD